MASATSQQDLPAKIEEEASNSDDETPASAGASRPPSSYPFPDFNPPPSRPASSCQFREPPTTFSLFPKPRASTPRLRRGSRPPVAFRTRSSSNLLDEFYTQPERRAPWHDTDDLARRQQMRDMDRQTIGELVDFLRNQAPPPDNFMSIPDGPDAEDDDRGRWLKLKPFANGRSRSAPKRPKPLRLPDSAVAGRTIGGHRHIAISIPVEHSPFGLNPTSQYPVYNKEGEPNTDQDSVMRFTDSNGVVTVLRTVSENQESPATDALSNKSRRPVSVTNEPLRTPVSRTQSLNEPSHTRDYSTASLPPTPLSHSRSCHLDLRSSETAAGQPRRVRSPTSPGSEGTPTSATTPSTPGRPRPMPRRWSVFPSANRTPAESIDGIMYGQRRPPASATARQPRAATYSGRPRSSTGASSCSNQTPAKANAARVPMIKVSSGRDSIMDWQGQVRDAVAEQEAGGRKPLESPTLPGRSTDSRQSRKEKVRQRKKRDIEASRASWGRRKAGADDDSLPRSSLTLSETSQAKADHESDNTDSGSRSTVARTPSITPLIVVADVEPSSPPPASPAAPLSPASAPARPTFTPPLTPRGRSPARSVQDRGFLSTRTDYGQASLAVRSTVSPARLQPISPDRAAYEGRLREIEQRMRKLESSGDMWMKSMVPVLDNLNHTLVKLQSERKCLGEDDLREMPEKKTPKPVILPMRKLTRRSTLNEKMLLDLRRIEKGEVDIIKDGSGLESVMRELQATSRESSPGKENASRREGMGVAI